MALDRIADDRGATIGFAALVLVTALLAALAPRVLVEPRRRGGAGRVRNAPAVARTSC